MSRSNPRSGGSNSPIKFRFKFSGQDGTVSYYDKDAKKDVEMESLDFILLDRRSSITGWNDADNSSIYSNLVASTKKEDLEVKTSKRTLFKGKYEEFKDKLEKAGGKFTTNLIALVLIDGNWEIGNIQLWSSGLAGLMEFEAEKHDMYAHIITIKAGETRKKGKVTYVVPEFGLSDLPEDLSDLALEKDKEVQEYFKGGNKAESAPEEQESDDEPKGKGKKDDLPF